jgi:hypothetical protein
MLELEYASSCKTSQTLIMPIECARAYDGLTHLLVDVDEDYDGYDARNFDLGAIFIASVGQPAEHAKIAEIWVTYEMWFYKPRLPRGVSSAAMHAQIYDCATADPLKNFLVMPGSLDGFWTEIDGDGVPRLHYPPGRRNWFTFLYWIENSLATTDVYELDTEDGTISLQLFSDIPGNDTATQVFVDNASAASPNKLMQAFIFSATGLSPSVGLIGGGLITGALGDVFVFALPPNLLTDPRSLSTNAGRVVGGRLNSHSNRMALLDRPTSAVDMNTVKRRANAAQSSKALVAARSRSTAPVAQRKAAEKTQAPGGGHTATRPRSGKRLSSEVKLLSKFLQDENAYEILMELERARNDRICHETGLPSSEEDEKTEGK